MRVSYLTAGAAGMYCGSCMHDNSLARALIQQGVDCILVPTYTPIRTDEDDVSGDEVFFGGINIYLEQKLWLWSKLPRTLTRWLDAPWVLRLATRKTGSTSPKLLGALTVSMLQGADGRQHIEVDRLCEWLETHADPDAVILSNLLIGGCIPTLRKRSRAKIIVTLQGDDIFLDFLPEPYRRQSIELMREIATDVDAFIVNSEFYGQKMAKILGLTPDQWHVVPLAIDLDTFPSTMDSEHAGDSPNEGPLKIGYFARIDPAKGLHHLVDAFIELHRQLAASASNNNEIELHVAGWLGDHNRSYAQQQWKKLDEAGLGGRYVYHGSPDHAEKVELLKSFDIFSVPTEYEEPKGLFVLEAMACGVPVVQPNHGSFSETIEPEETGMLYQPGDVQEHVDALRRLIENPHIRQRIGATGRSFVMDTRGIQAMATSVKSLIENLPNG